MRKGGVSSGPSATMLAPILRSGAITRSIGRRESPASPTSRLSKVCPARSPARSRIVVPEFPQSISPFGGDNTRFFPCTISVSGSGCSILTPKARMAFTVCMQSSPGRNPRRVHTPLDKAAMITARCEILLSPGTAISRSIRGARFTLNSIRSMRQRDYQMSDAKLDEKRSLNRAAAITCYRSDKLVTAPGRFCRYRDLSLLFLEEILRHRRTCPANKDSPRGAVCQELEFRRDNLPLLLLSAQPWAEAMLSLPLAEEWLEPVRSD